MKLLTILLILLQINTFGYGNYNSPYSNNYNSYSSVHVEQTNRRIGYTTNYGNTFGYTTQQTYSGTYNPGTGSNSSGRPGQPRRVHGYTGDGNYVGDDNGSDSDFWDPKYEYYWDDIDKCWYRKPVGDSNDWQKYTNTLGVLFGWHWSYTSWGGRKPPSNPVSQSYEENPVPIGDVILPLLTILLLYIGYDTLVKSRLKK